MDDNGVSPWTQKGATLSDKTAAKEYGLSRADIIDAIRRGALQFREGSIYGNPYFRLLRSEVELLYKQKFGQASLEKEKAMIEVKKIKAEIRKLKTRIDVLETRKKELALRNQSLPVQ